MTVTPVAKLPIALRKSAWLTVMDRMDRRARESIEIRTPAMNCNPLQSSGV
jgi:hypothetical protein